MKSQCKFLQRPESIKSICFRIKVHFISLKLHLRVMKTKGLLIWLLFSPPYISMRQYKWKAHSSPYHFQNMTLLSSETFLPKPVMWCNNTHSTPWLYLASPCPWAHHSHAWLLKGLRCLSVNSAITWCSRWKTSFTTQHVGVITLSLKMDFGCSCCPLSPGLLVCNRKTQKLSSIISLCAKNYFEVVTLIPQGL